MRFFFIFFNFLRSLTMVVNILGLTFAASKASFLITPWYPDYCFSPPDSKSSFQDQYLIWCLCSRHIWTNHTMFPKWFCLFVYLAACLTAVNIALAGHDKISVMNLLPNCQITYTIIYQGKMKKSRTFLFFFLNENPHHTSPDSEESFVSLRALFNYQKTYTII